MYWRSIRRKEYLQHTRDHLLVLFAPWCTLEAFGDFDDLIIFLLLGHDEVT